MPGRCGAGVPTNVPTNVPALINFADTRPRERPHGRLKGAHGCFDVSVATEALGDLVRSELTFLLDEHDFAVLREDEYIVELESPTLCAQVVWDPRGEVDVNVRRRGVERFGDARYGQWSYVGMVGRASVPRLLQLAGERLRAEPRVLQADDDYFDQLAVEQRQEAQEWTAYYSRKGPRPRRGQLP